MENTAKEKKAMNYPKVRLGEVCDGHINRIKSLSIKEIDYIDISSIDRTKKTVSSTTKYEVAKAPGRAQQLVRENDLLVSMVRPNLNAIALVPRFPLGVTPVASTGFSVLRASSKVLPKWLYFFCQTDEFICSLVSVSSKASYPSVTETVVRDSLIPLPPLSVQQEKVSRLEAELSRMEAIAVEANHGLSLCTELRKAILQEAFI